MTGSSAETFVVDIDERGSGVHLTCIGELDITTSQQLDEVFERCLDAAPASVTLDFRRVPFVDSSGVRTLLRFTQRCVDKAIDVTLFASEQLRKVSKTLGLEDVLSIQTPGDGTG
jgi:anti-anti-sigma factor